MEDKKPDSSKPPETPENKPKLIQKRRTRKVNLDYLERQAKTILAREMEHLLDESYDKKLSRDSSQAIRDHLKTIRDLRVDRDKYLDSLSVEELTKEAAKDEQEDSSEPGAE